MTADFESALKRAWDSIDCPQHCPIPWGDSLCKGHAALLEMVDGVHLAMCECHSDCSGILRHNGMLGPGRPCPTKHRAENPTRQHIDERCNGERRRLRAAVGVKESDDAH